jgi:hypothetical protein
MNISENGYRSEKAMEIIKIAGSYEITGRRMEDDSIYFINQYSLLKRPRIWSKRGYWTFQTVSSVIDVPLLVLSMMFFGLLLLSSTIVMLIIFVSSAYNFYQGRRRAERYRAELANGIVSPYFGKYRIEVTRRFMRL